eukprot:9496631-Pyramimonas_sp.AAC.1
MPPRRPRTASQKTPRGLPKKHLDDPVWPQEQHKMPARGFLLRPFPFLLLLLLIIFILLLSFSSSPPPPLPPPSSSPSSSAAPQWPRARGEAAAIVQHGPAE